MGSIRSTTSPTPSMDLMFDPQSVTENLTYASNQPTFHQGSHHTPQLTRFSSDTLHNEANYATSSDIMYDDPYESRINLPPNVNFSAGLMEGEAPNVLADRMLGLHTKPVRPGVGPLASVGANVDNERSKSWLSILGGPRRRNYSQESDQHSEQEPYIECVRDQALDMGDSLDEELWQDSRSHRPYDQRQHGSSAQSLLQSKRTSQKKPLKWYQRPSPLWFLPGTLIMSSCMGMIIAPKIEIYTQLVCRAVGADKSGVVLPPPELTCLIGDFDRGKFGGAVDDFAINGDVPNLQHDSKISVSENLYGFVNLEQYRMTRHNQLKFNDYALLSDDCVVLRTSRSSVISWDEAGSTEDTWSKQCRNSREVQKAVTALALSLSLVMGILSALTTGFWGALSDRRGRKPVIALAIFGTVCMDGIFLIAVNYHQVVGYQFLLIGPAIDGLLGGMTTASAATNAYLSDCTESGSRARLFSIIGGLMFGGFAIGPIIGAMLIRASGSVLLPFYFALGLHSAYLCALLIIFPESLSKKRQYEARRRHASELLARAASEKEEDEKAREKGILSVLSIRLRRAAFRPFTFLRPLSLLLPSSKGVDHQPEDRSILESRGAIQEGLDWELTKVALGYGSYYMIIAVMAVKILYTGFKFGWGPQENGYYLSFIGVCRVFVLLVVLPTLIKVFRKPPPLPNYPRPEDERRDILIDSPVEVEIESEGGRLIGAQRTEADNRDAVNVVRQTDHGLRLSQSQVDWENEAKYLRVVNDSHFDLFLSRVSVLNDMVAYGYMALNNGSPANFLLATAMQSFGGGGAPAMLSLALAHASPRDSGRLFASLSVLGSISSSVIGPIFFGTVFIESVGIFSELVFCCAFALLSISMAFFLSVRLKRKIITVDGENEIEGFAEGMTVATRKNGGRRVLVVDGSVRSDRKKRRRSQAT